MDLSKLVKANSDRVAAIVLVIIGLIALGLGYVGVADEVFAAAQIPFVISGGLLGIFLLGIAGTLWLSADLRDEWRKLDDLLSAVQAPTASTSEPAASSVLMALPPPYLQYAIGADGQPVLIHSSPAASRSQNGQPTAVPAPMMTAAPDDPTAPHPTSGWEPPAADHAGG